MRFLIDARSLGEKPSGVGMYIYNFITSLHCDCKDEIMLVTDIAVSEEMKMLKKKGVKIISLGEKIYKNFSLFTYFRFVQQCIYKYKPDIFWEANNLFLTRLKNPYGKIVVTVHDVFPITMPECYGKVYQYYFRYGLSHTLKYTDLILYNSSVTKNEVESYYKKAIQKPNFVSYIIVDKMPEIPISDQGYFLYIGNLEKRKGTDILIDAYLKYIKEGGERELHIGGKIREKEIDEKLKEACKITSKLKYLGYVSNEMKLKCYAECGCFVFPSRAEGFGIPVIEALNYFKPVIVSDLPVFLEIGGRCLNYFEMSPGNNEEEINNLVNCMNGYQKPSIEKCHKVTESYKAEILTNKLIHFLKKELLGD